MRLAGATWIGRGVVSLAVVAGGGAAMAAAVPESLLSALTWREVGPYRGGRVAAVTGVPSDRTTYYQGATGGGVWKTTDGGATWKNVSDGSFGGSIGAVAVSEADPNVVYVGGGEKTVRGNVSHGDGIWKSTDAGRTWKHVGLTDSRHVPRIRVHPRDPDLVYVAALGHLFGPSDERGVYRSSDGGATWTRVLFVSADAGAVDLALDPVNPRVLYASFWRVRRTPWELSSGGEGSSLWKSTDGGDTWAEITRNPGLPAGTVGIIGVTVSPSNHDNLYAIVEAEDGGVFRSRDAGATWTRVNQDRSLRQRAWYYTRIYADPAGEEGVWVVNVELHHSRDGGKGFRTVETRHGDHHDLWIDPADPARMIVGDDGGAAVSVDGGESWSSLDNQPTAQIYRVTLDDAFPYRLYGAQQDNSSLRIRSRSDGWGIGERDWEPTAGGESGHIVADPQDNEVVFGGSYGGFLVRLNHRTGEVRDVNPWPDNPMGWGAAGLKYRFQWNFPIFVSPHDPDTLYAAANVLFRSRDEGQSWQAISPDLTRNDPSKQGPSGGPITKDNTSVEYYCTIFAGLESPHEAGVLWTGSDDGLIHLSRDGGATWTNVTPGGMPAWIQVNSLEAHPFAPGGLYVAATRYKSDDLRPYLYRTTDYGATWARIDRGIAGDHFTRVVRADPERRGLLYAGTERGVYVSFDDGGSWQPLQMNLPVVPVTDLAIRGDELVAATQGRGFWILGGLSVLRQLQPGTAKAALHLFAPAPSWRMRGRGGDAPGRGDNPPNGVVLYYALAAAPEKDAIVKLEILAPGGTVLRAFPDQGGPDRGGDGADEEEPKPADTPPVKAGLNRFVWDMRVADAKGFDGLVMWAGTLRGPRVVPGAYRARLTVGSETAEASFEIVADPRSATSADDLRAQYELLLAIRDTLTRTHEAITAIRAVREQLEALKGRLQKGDGDVVREAAVALGERLTEVEQALYQTANRSPQDPLNYPIRFNNKLAALAGSVAIGDARPTDQARAVNAELTAAIEAELAKLEAIWTVDLPALNALVAEKGVPALARP